LAGSDVPDSSQTDGTFLLPGRLVSVTSPQLPCEHRQYSNKIARLIDYLINTYEKSMGYQYYYDLFVD
jgi:hypothetical protein